MVGLVTKESTLRGPGSGAPVPVPLANVLGIDDDPAIRNILRQALEADGYQVVTVTGELDVATAEQAYAYISGIIDEGRAPVSVDLGGLTFCDASGLGMLAKAARHARQAGRQLTLTSARPSLLKIMRITGLDRAFPELRPSAHAYSA